MRKVIKFSFRFREVLGALCAVLVAAGLYAGLVYAPPDSYQRDLQRIMYIHVPCAWNAYLAFGCVALFSVLYLVTRHKVWDLMAVSAAFTGVLFTGITLFTGSVWGKPVWGTWWTWDARLTTTLILFLIYVGYLMMRNFLRDDSRLETFCAVLGIIGAVDIPVVHFSVVWWRTLHQPPTIINPQGVKMGGAMLFALLFNLFVFTLVYFYLFIKRLHLETLRWKQDRPLEDHFD